MSPMHAIEKRRVAVVHGFLELRYLEHLAWITAIYVAQRTVGTKYLVHYFLYMTSAFYVKIAHTSLIFEFKIQNNEFDLILHCCKLMTMTRLLIINDGLSLDTFSFA